ncbi:MAG: hypothetical protein A3G64_02905 [Candidatus Liptonbacteria bacterium RIFCSPLOWO2_12_FULL_60_15]|uniref:Uncharacterized protein n=1 Tax=Candidatus Liptonbacteria bacterium RIFCSPLOWO2_12_FULL_60_15 TaxID=1798653 RepID=A0A1G2CLH6_9BACT|nr:MAG: hypothetical protein A3G64_02905 [Candidatus Liptonbacteria bacterium RIFCSPLOWO2_12_FULL_60_15]
MALSTKEKAVFLPLRLTAPHTVAKVLALVYSDEGTVAAAMGPEGSPLLQYAHGMQKKMLFTVLELLNRCEGERDLNALKEGLRAWVTRS